MRHQLLGREGSPAKRSTKRCDGFLAVAAHQETAVAVVSVEIDEQDALPRLAGQQIRQVGRQRGFAAPAAGRDDRDDATQGRLGSLDEAGCPLRDVAKPTAQGVQDLAVDAAAERRLRIEQRFEAGGRDLQQDRVTGRTRRGGSRGFAIEEGHLPEKIVLAEGRDEFGRSRQVANADLHLARMDDEQVAGRVALLKNNVAAPHFLAADHGFEFFDLFGGKFAEQGYIFQHDRPFPTKRIFSMINTPRRQCNILFEAHYFTRVRGREAS